MTMRKPVLRIEEDGSIASAFEDEIDSDDCQMVEDGTLQIVRFVAFTSAEAQSLSGKAGRFELLEVEAETTVEEGDDPEEAEEVVVWNKSWEPL